MKPSEKNRFDEAEGERPAAPCAEAPASPRQRVRELILSRRARFVGVALAGVGLAWGSKACSPCLSMAPPARRPEVTVDQPDGGAGGADDGTTEPRVCLEAPVEPDPDPEPCLEVMPPDEPAHPCLSIVAPPPTPCLSIRPPRPGPCLSPPAPPPTVCLRAPIEPPDEG